MNESKAEEDALKQTKDLWVLASGEEAVKHHRHLINPWQQCEHGLISSI